MGFFGGGGGAAAPADMVGATTSVAGTAGLVPAPAAGEQTAFLGGNATFTQALYNLPIHKLDNTNFYVPIGFGGNVNVNSTNSVSNLTPIFLPNGSIDRLSCYQNSASGTGTGYVAIYSTNANGKPLSVLTSGSFSITSGESAVEKAVTLSPTYAIKAGLYWIGYHNTNITANYKATGNASTTIALFTGTRAGIDAHYSAARISIASAGTWPDDPTIASWQTANQVAVLVRMT